MRGAAAGAALLLALAPAALGCTLVAVQSGEEAGAVIGRTMEYWNTTGARDWVAAVHPKGTWLGNRFAFLSIDTGDAAVVNPNVTGEVTSEGMNEAGVTISSNTLMMAEYQSPAPGVPTVWFNEFVPWVLGNFGSVPELVAALPTVRVCNPGLGPDLRAHWAVADAAGHSVVIEYIHGAAVVHNNSVGVMTNDPPYDWHLLNLNSYANLRPEWPGDNADIGMQTAAGAGGFNGVVPQPISQGANLLGLPGDFTAASRFTRAFYLRQYAMRAAPVTNADDGIVLATGIINNVYKIPGSIADQGARAGKEFTPYAVVKIPRLRRYLYRTARDMSWRGIDLRRLDLTQRAALPLADGLGVRDVTADLRPVR